MHLLNYVYNCFWVQTGLRKLLDYIAIVKRYEFCPQILNLKGVVIQTKYSKLQKMSPPPLNFFLASAQILICTNC